MKKILFIVLLAAFVLQGSAQITLEERIEFEIRDGYGDENIVPFGNLGVLVMTKRDKAENQQDLWRFQLYDTTLKLIEEENFELHVSFYLDEYFHSDDKFYCLFRKKSGSYSILEIDIPSMKMRSIEGEFDRSDWITDIAVVGNSVYMMAEGRREKMIYKLDLESEALKKIVIELDDFKLKQYNIQNFQVLEEADELFVFVLGAKRKETEMHVMRFNSDGERTLNTRIDRNIDNNLLDVTITKVEDDKYAFTGTYGVGTSKASQGIYFGILKNGVRSDISFYNFLDLENFLNYLPDRRVEKLKKKQDRKASRGKELAISYNIETHPIIYKNGKYVFLGEAYYATYRTETYTTTVNGQTVTRTRQVFDGYQYTHAMLAAFNEEGDLLWDNIFEMWPSYKPMRPIKFISVAEDLETQISMVFSSYGSIITMAFDYEGETLNERNWEWIETGDESEEVKRGFSTNQYWYDRYFINYGQAKIKDNDKGFLQKKRKVYFISKIGY
ncbi:hypothetical protein GYB22_00770 [bacterium]|nr:hypothetical protein [bacterium]